jgi:hypothetical protein
MDLYQLFQSSLYLVTHKNHFVLKVHNSVEIHSSGKHEYYEQVVQLLINPVKFLFIEIPLKVQEM